MEIPLIWNQLRNLEISGDGQRINSSGFRVRVFFFFFNFLKKCFKQKNYFRVISYRFKNIPFCGDTYLDKAYIGECCPDIRFQYKMYQYHIFSILIISRFGFHLLERIFKASVSAIHLITPCYHAQPHPLSNNY